MIYISVEHAILLHDMLLNRHGGLPGIRDYNSLCSALDAPQAALFGMEMYPKAHEKASVYLFHLICNHPFNDANKRTACAVSMAFLELNNIQTTYSEAEFESLAVEIASGNVTKENVMLLLQPSLSR
jgi:death-on-curing protein